MDLEELVDARHAALIVVDMQNDYCDSNGALARSGSDPALIQAMAPRLLRLLDGARRVSIPIVHVRTEHSPWTDSADLDLVRLANNIRTVIMTGEATNVCVESTARDAFMRDYRVVFVSDCTAATVQAAHDATVFTIGRHFGTVATGDDVLAAWSATVPLQSPRGAQAWS